MRATITAILSVMLGMTSVTAQTLLSYGFEESEQTGDTPAYIGFVEDGDVFGTVDAPYLTIDPLDGTGGRRFLSVTTCGEDVEAGTRLMCLGGFEPEENKSYRITYYMKSSAAAASSAFVSVRGSRGDVPVVSASGDRFRYGYCNQDSLDCWVRHTAMFHYAGADAQRHHTGNDVKGFMLNISFDTGNARYSLDELSIVESDIAGIYCRGDQIRVDFGFPTTIAAQASASQSGGIILDTGCLSVMAGGKEVELFSVELHPDGFLYAWTEGVNLENADGDVTVSFRNPRGTPDVIRYSTGLRPGTSAEKDMPVHDFTDEKAVREDPWRQESSEVIPIILSKPLFVTSYPDDGSFCLTDDTDTFRFVYDRRVIISDDTRAVLTDGHHTENLAVVGVGDSGRTVVFVRTNGEHLDGDYTIRADGVRSHPGGDAESCSISLSYGTESDNVPETLLKTLFASQQVGTVAEGFHVIDGSGDWSDGQTSSGSRLMAFTPDSDIPVAMYWSPRASQNGGSLYCGDNASGTRLYLSAGEYSVSFPVVGWETNTQEVRFSIYEKDNPDNVLFSTAYTPSVSANRNEYFTGADFLSFGFTVKKGAEYVLKWFIAYNESNGGWGCSAIGDVTLQRLMPQHMIFRLMLEEALERAVSVAASVRSKPEYGGPELMRLDSLANCYTGWESTSPNAFRKAVSELYAVCDDIQVRKGVVDGFKDNLATAGRFVTRYTGSIISGMQAYIVLCELWSEYSQLDLTVTGMDFIGTVSAELAESVNLVLKQLDDGKKLAQVLADAKEYLDRNAVYSTQEVYREMYRLYEKGSSLDVYRCTDNDILDIIDGLKELENRLERMKSVAPELTRQIRRLNELMDRLEADPAVCGLDRSAVAGQIKACLTDDAELSALLEMIVAERTCEQFAAGRDITDNDFSCFIRNAQLYTAVRADDATSGLINGDCVEPYPGWNFTWLGGNIYPGVSWDCLYATEENPYRDSRIGLDWNAKFTMEQTICYLPAGIYELSLGCGTPDATDSYISVSQFVDGMPAVQDADIPKGGDQSVWDSQIVTLRNLRLYGGPVTIAVSVNSGSSWSSIDLFTLKLTAPLEGYDYGSAAALLRSEAENKWNSSVQVDSPPAAGSTEIWYGADGVPGQGPRPGLNLRKTVRSDGTVSVEKVWIRQRE